MEGALQDLRLALRRLRARPTATTAALLVLATGIGATLVMAAVFDAVLLRPLDFPEPDRLVVVEERGPEGEAGNEDWGNTSFPTFEDVRRQASPAFEAIAGFRFRSAYLTGANEPEQLLYAFVTPGFFRTLGVAPELGRTFTDDEGEGRSGPVVVLGHRLWQRQLGRREDVVGDSILLDRVPHEVVGVMPEGFAYPSWAAAWIPFGDPGSTAARDDRDIAIVARLARGASPQRARSEVEALGAALAAEHPGDFGGHSLGVRPLLDTYVADSRPVLVTMLAAVLGFLAVVCLNLATLQTAGALDRRQEMAVRTALGAGRARVVRLLMTENLLLATLGGLLGILVAAWGLEAAISLAPEGVPRLEDARIDGRLTVFAVLVTSLTAVVFGLLPSWLASRMAPQEGLRGGRGSSHDRKAVKARTVMVVAQIALTLTMLTAAGLTVRSFRSLLDTRLGFDFDRLASVGFVLPASELPERHQRVRWVEEVFAAVRRVPGVEAVSTINFKPLDDYRQARTIHAPGSALDDDGLTIAELAVSYGYFETTGIPIVAGRPFRKTDGEDREGVVVVSRDLSRKIWGSRSPVGQPLQLEGSGGERDVVTVVGVAEDVRHTGIAAGTVDQIYRPYAQTGWLYSNLIVRSRPETAPEDLLVPIQRAVQSVDPDRPLFDATTASSARRLELAQPRLRSWLLSLFSCLGLMLAAFGVYSVLAVSVRSRHREIGIRLALGSSRAGARRLVVGEGVVLIALGIVVGAPLAWAAGRLLSTQLHGVEPFDLPTLAGALALLAVVAYVAILGPAARAGRIDPTVALRED